MKSNQERSNECLPPKKREILALEERQVLVAAAVSESQRGENLAWLASVATMASMVQGHGDRGNTEALSPSPSLKPLSVVTEHQASMSASCSTNSTPREILSGPALTSQPALLSPCLPQPAGTVQYTQLPPNLQLIGPYTGYISSQIVPSTASPAHPAPQPQEGYATAIVSQSSNGEPQSQRGVVTSSVPNAVHPVSQCIQIESAALRVTTVTSPTPHVPIQLHPHSAVLAPHALALAPSQVLLHYTDGLTTKPPESHGRELQNGEIRDATAAKHNSNMVKGVSSQPEGDQSQRQQQNIGLQAQAQVLLPAEYTAQDSSGLQTSIMLLSNTTTNNSELAKDSVTVGERGGICLGKPISRTSSTLPLSSSDGLPSPAQTLSPHAILQTSHSATHELSTGIYSATQLPIIGYITSAGAGHQQSVAGYHSNMPQHLVISGSPSLLIPVSTSNVSVPPAEPEVPRCSVTSITSVVPPTVATALPQAYITSTTSAALAALPKGVEVMGSKGQYAGPLVQSQTQVQLPVLSASLVAPPAPVSPQNSPTTPPVTLPPYFMKGSIIQLADGELKRVEDLRTEDFLQSAEVSGELKIDSSTVERIDCSRTPDAVIIQFSVGEHKAQVCVEVLVEYPFFVFGQGWSSCCPDRTTQLLELSCAKLSVGDVCISLTLKSLKNGTLRKDQTPDFAGNHSDLHVKATRPNGQVNAHAVQREALESGLRLGAGVQGGATSVGAADMQNGIGSVGPADTGKVLTPTESGEAEAKMKMNCLQMPGQTDGSGPERTERAGRVVTRKRRWSAPERSQAQKFSEEEPPVTLPKLSFIPQELKINIEGRSSTGC
ncbi:ataxin-1 [Chanos chanos]|uniref:Ataxin-1 n=1 Tax=Chanos chanos TaxID=29144 RepID=A0A6J2W2M4_CHACN|nr:ataxin-1-like [Chanos chanos]